MNCESMCDRSWTNGEENLERFVVVLTDSIFLYYDSIHVDESGLKYDINRLAENLTQRQMQMIGVQWSIMRERMPDMFPIRIRAAARRAYDLLTVACMSQGESLSR